MIPVLFRQKQKTNDAVILYLTADTVPKTAHSRQQVVASVSRISCNRNNGSVVSERICLFIFMLNC